MRRKRLSVGQITAVIQQAGPECRPWIYATRSRYPSSPATAGRRCAAVWSPLRHASSSFCARGGPASWRRPHRRDGESARMIPVVMPQPRATVTEAMLVYWHQEPGELEEARVPLFETENEIAVTEGRDRHWSAWRSARSCRPKCRRRLAPSDNLSRAPTARYRIRARAPFPYRARIAAGTFAERGAND